MQNNTIGSVDDYILQFPEHVRAILTKIRIIIRTTAPEALEGMAYGMPSYKYRRKPLVYFAAYSKHIGFYATPNTHAFFADRLVEFKQGKGSVQFPLNKPIPYELITDMVKFKRDSSSLD